MGAMQTVVTYGRMIKFSHSVFALPFALSGAALAASVSAVDLGQVVWIVVAMVGARSAAMGFNRLADRHLDAANPRTAQRELPRGAVSPGAVAFFVVVSAAALVWAAYQLNPLCFSLSPAVLAVLLFYSLTKRFTWACHLVLGLCLGGAPVGAWLAIAGEFAWPPLLLGAAVLCWVAGFDILYSCQDYAFDRDSGLHSIPVRFGLARSLHFARLLHLGAVGCMLAVGYMMGLEVVFYLGVVLIAGLLVYEHLLVRPDDLSKVNMAFVTMNSVISVVFFVFTLADLLIMGQGPLWRG